MNRILFLEGEESISRGVWFMLDKRRVFRYIHVGDAARALAADKRLQMVLSFVLRRTVKKESLMERI